MRERSSQYYLESVRSPASLYADGTVGRLEVQASEVEVELPTRVEGRQYTVKRHVKHLAQTALYGSLADYVAGQRLSGGRQHDMSDHLDWTLEDIPADVVVEYEAWGRRCDEAGLEGAIRSVAASQVAPLDQLQDLAPCSHCSTDSQYECYTCGHDRQLYRYPLVRFQTSSGTIDAPLDVARAIDLNPEVLKDSRDYHVGRDESLHAERKLVFDANLIPASYLNLRDGELLGVDPSDKLYDPVEMKLNYWSENKSLAERKTNFYQDDLNKYGQVETAEGYIQRLQQHVAQDVVRELPGGEVYEQKYQHILKKAGSLGLALTFGYYYEGMGNTDIRFGLVNPKRHFQPVVHSLSVAQDVRQAISKTVAAINDLT